MGQVTEASKVIPVSGPADVEVACRVAAGFAGESGFSTREIGELVLIVSELGTNLLRHAENGTLTIERGINDGQGYAVVVSQDGGPGIRDIEAAMQDGQGKAGGMGAGLGAVQRLSDTLHITSTTSGTTVRATKRAPKVPQLSVGIAQKCHPRESVSGDAWVSFSPAPGNYRVGVIDGAGHGEQAAEAALLARDAVIRCANMPLATTFERCHTALKGTRGAVMSLISFDLSIMSVEVAGVGNVDGRIRSGDREQHAVMQRGMLGASLPRVRPMTFRLEADWSIALYSDGVKTRFSLTDYHTPASSAAASELAEALLCDWIRGEDDATVLVVLPGVGTTPDRARA